MGAKLLGVALNMPGGSPSHCAVQKLLDLLLGDQMLAQRARGVQEPATDEPAHSLFGDVSVDIIP